MKYAIRPMKPEEYDLLQDFLYEALYVPEGHVPHPRSILSTPELRLYYDNFGSDKDDLALVACSEDGKVAGCVWTRIMNDYSHLDDETPSLVVSLYDGCRGQGLGTALIEAMLDAVRKNGRKAVSLSVQVSHPAQHLYRRLGFVEVGRAMGETEEEIVMRYDLAKDR